jgi:hypothetical protein
LGTTAAAAATDAVEDESCLTLRPLSFFMVRVKVNPL